MAEVAMSVYLTNENTKKYINSILGERTNQFITSLTSMASSSETLKNCNRNSLLACALKAVSLELPFDQNLGFAWAVPYKNVATFQIGCKGYIQLALRTGQYKFLNARVGELSGRDYIGDLIINWLSDEERENKQIIGYMAGLELVNGFKKIIYWSTSEIEKHANRYSQSYKRNSKFNNVWSSNFDKMAEKILMKALISRYGILSTDMQRAVQSDHSKINIDFETGTETIDYFDNPTTETLSVGLTTEQQAELLKTYGAERVSKALENLKIDSLNQVQFDELEDFKKAVSGEVSVTI